MKRTAAWILVMSLLAPAAWPAQLNDQEWPADMERVQTIVAKAVGKVSYDRVKVRRSGNEIEVSIKLKNLPRHFRTQIQERATEDEVFLATNIVELLEPDFSTDIMGFNLTPVADLLTYFYGYAVFNFGNKIKLRKEISVRELGDEVPEIEKVKKRQKLKKQTLSLHFVEDTVEGDGFYELFTKIGPWEKLSYFCVGCDG